MEECDVLIDIIQQRRQIIGSKIKEGKVNCNDIGDILIHSACVFHITSIRNVYICGCIVNNDLIRFNTVLHNDIDCISNNSIIRSLTVAVISILHAPQELKTAAHPVGALTSNQSSLTMCRTVNKSTTYRLTDGTKTCTEVPWCGMIKVLSVLLSNGL